MRLTNIFRNRTVKNAGWIMGGKIAQMVISLIVGMLTARFLGPSNFGLINYASAFTAFFMAFCTLGINNVLVKEFVERPEDEGLVLGTTLVLRAVSSLMSAGVIILIVWFIDADEPTTIAVVALSCVGLVFHIFDAFHYRFQAQLKSKITAIVSLIAYGVTAVYKIILLILNKNVQYFAFSTSVDYICVAVLLFIAYKRHDGKPLRFSWAYGRSLLKKSYHFILSGMMVAIYGQTDKLMLKQMLGGADVGFYSTATAICAMWCFVLQAIIDSIYPTIVEAYKIDEELFKKRNRLLYSIVFYVSVGVSVIFCIFAELIIYILYGADYLPAANPLRIVTWYTAFSYLGVARNCWIVCKGRQKYLKYIYLSAAVMNVGLNFLLIPGFGASGAAMASLVTQILTSIVLPLFIPALKENSKLMLEAIMLKGVIPKKK